MIGRLFRCDDNGQTAKVRIDFLEIRGLMNCFNEAGSPAGSGRGAAGIQPLD